MKTLDTHRAWRSAARSSSSPLPYHRSRNGFTYLALLVAVIIIGISLGAATKYWANISLRDKEEELLYRGDQYRQAIEAYMKAIPGRQELPASIDDLLKDNRTAVPKRHLRQKYKDPITGEDFVEIRDQMRIVGVHSPSENTPLKQSNFPDKDKDFDGKQKYSDWAFVASAKPGPGGVGIAGSGAAGTSAGGTAVQPGGASGGPGGTTASGGTTVRPVRTWGYKGP